MSASKSLCCRQVHFLTSKTSHSDVAFAMKTLSQSCHATSQSHIVMSRWRFCDVVRLHGSIISITKIINNEKLKSSIDNSDNWRFELSNLNFVFLKTNFNVYLMQQSIIQSSLLMIIRLFSHSGELARSNFTRFN